MLKCFKLWNLNFSLLSHRSFLIFVPSAVSVHHLWRDILTRIIWVKNENFLSMFFWSFVLNFMMFSYFLTDPSSSSSSDLVELTLNREPCFLVSLWPCPLDVSCLHEMKRACAKKKKEEKKKRHRLIHSVHDLYDLFPGCIFWLSKEQTVSVSGFKERKKKWSLKNILSENHQTGAETLSEKRGSGVWSFAAWSVTRLSLLQSFGL